jgi:hypothetical protein
MLLVTILVSNHSYAFQNISRPSVICNVVKLCLGTNNTLDICNVSVLGIYRMCILIESIILTEELLSIFLLIAPNIEKCLCEPVTVAIGLEFLSNHNIPFLQQNQRRKMIHLVILQ